MPPPATQACSPPRRQLELRSARRRPRPQFKHARAAGVTRPATPAGGRCPVDPTVLSVKHGSGLGLSRLWPAAGCGCDRAECMVQTGDDHRWADGGRPLSRDAVDCHSRAGVGRPGDARCYWVDTGSEVQRSKACANACVRWWHSLQSSAGVTCIVHGDRMARGRRMSTATRQMSR